MGTNTVPKSLRHNDNLFDLPLPEIIFLIYLYQRATSNVTGCNHCVKILSGMCILSASKSAAMAARALEWKEDIGARAAD